MKLYKEAEVMKIRTWSRSYRAISQHSGLNEPFLNSDPLCNQLCHYCPTPFASGHCGQKIEGSWQPLKIINKYITCFKQ